MKAPRLVSRRELLSGLAAAPALAAMLRTARAQSAGVPRPRFCYLYWGNGAHPQWTPPDGPDGTFGTLPAPMEPLEPIRQDLVIIKNLMVLYPGDISHSGSHYTQLTGIDPVVTNGVPNSDSATEAKAPSVDQVIADKIAAGLYRTPIPSLQVGVVISPGNMGRPISWAAQAPYVGLPPEKDPLRVYERVTSFINPSTVSEDALRKRLAVRKSVLDGVRADVQRLNARISSADREHMDAYLTALRQVEDGFSAALTPHPTTVTSGSIPPPPTGGALTSTTLKNHPVILERHLDIVAFALAAGLTRVATVQMSDGSLHYPAQWLGQNNEAHGISHYIQFAGENGLSQQQRLDLIVKHQQYWNGKFVYFVKKLKAVPEGGGTVLDNTMAVLGAQNGDSQAHAGLNTPFVIAGSGGGRIKTGGRLYDAKGRNHNDLLVSMANVMGLPEVTTFGGCVVPGRRGPLCRGPLPGLAA